MAELEVDAVVDDEDPGYDLAVKLCKAERNKIFDRNVDEHLARSWLHIVNIEFEAILRLQNATASRSCNCCKIRRAMNMGPEGRDPEGTKTKESFTHQYRR